ncbi:MAG: hypothetical protein V4714_11305 [Bacteroidota bacterium]
MIVIENKPFSKPEKTKLGKADLLPTVVLYSLFWLVAFFKTIAEATLLNFLLANKYFFSFADLIIHKINSKIMLIISCSGTPTIFQTHLNP